ncbi:hypothetical protein P7C70_g6142, partial [Phenoliferia sp. Uapishka_3]
MQNFFEKARHGEFTAVLLTKYFFGQDGTSPLNITLRALQTFLPFINLCIYIGIAVFQKHWGVGVSFLTGLSLFMNAQSLLHGALFLSTPLLYERLLFLRGVARGLRQIRIGIIVNGCQTALMLIMGLATTVSANTGGCKNASSDEHADLDGYTDAMGPFCRNKRAGAAFFWLNFLAWATTLGLILLAWFKIRKNPRAIGGFAIPGSQFRQDDEDAFAHSDGESQTPGVGGAGGASMGYRPSGDYYTGEGESRLFSESAVGYGDDSYHPQTRDPFEDQPTYGGHEDPDVDPYQAIRKSMDVRPGY